MIEKVNLAEKLSLFDERWSPKIVADLNDGQVKVVKLDGGFVGTTTTTRTSSFWSFPGACGCSFGTARSSSSPGS